MQSQVLEVIPDEFIQFISLTIKQQELVDSIAKADDEDEPGMLTEEFMREYVSFLEIKKPSETIYAEYSKKLKELGLGCSLNGDLQRKSLRHLRQPPPKRRKIFKLLADLSCFDFKSHYYELTKRTDCEVIKISILEEVAENMLSLCVELYTGRWLDIVVFNGERNKSQIIQEVHRYLIEQLFPEYYSVLVLIGMHEEIARGEIELELTKRWGDSSGAKKHYKQEPENERSEFLPFRNGIESSQIIIRDKLLRLMYNDYISILLEESTKRMIILDEFKIQQLPSLKPRGDEFIEDDFSVIYEFYQREGKKNIYKCLWRLIESIYDMRIEVFRNGKIYWVEATYLGNSNTCFCLEMSSSFNFKKIMIYLFCNFYFGRLIEFVGNIDKYGSFSDTFNSVKRGQKKIRYLEDTINTLEEVQVSLMEADPTKEYTLKEVVDTLEEKMKMKEDIKTLRENLKEKKLALKVNLN